ncbi:MAG TPA: threonine/serine dehydratase, partial [Lysobacter sp.]|nr:threonine/serine dehydratase [Lysobacter sp.]
FWQRTKQMIEPSSAIALAVVLANRDRFAGQRVGVIVSGGNVDLEALGRWFARG